MEPSDRRKLAKFLEKLDLDKGELVFDLELVMVADDENDQGYYEDEPVTQEEVSRVYICTYICYLGVFICIHIYAIQGCYGDETHSHTEKKRCR